VSTHLASPIVGRPVLAVHAFAAAWGFGKRHHLPFCASLRERRGGSAVLIPLATDARPPQREQDLAGVSVLVLVVFCSSHWMA
jgi:hypothetical protein